MPTLASAATILVRQRHALAAATTTVTRGTFRAQTGVTVAVVGGYPAQVPVYGRKDRLADGQRHLIRRGARAVGTYVRWTPAIRCSCALEGGQVMTTCRVCRGWGWFWRDQDERKLGGDLTQATIHREYQVMGILMPGDLVFVPERRGHFAPQDRIRIARPDLYHLKMRGEAELVRRDPEGGATDELPYRVAELLRVTRADPYTGTVTSYRPGIDVVASGTTLTWDAKLPAPHAGTVAPGDGQRYAVDFMADYDWLVQEPPTPRGVGEVGLGGKLLIRKRHRSVTLDRPAPFDPGVQ